VLELALHSVVAAMACFSVMTAFSNTRFLNRKSSTVMKNTRIDTVTVSVLIPARDEENRISECLQSLISQCSNVIEIIVLDDRSTDATAEIVMEFSEQDSRVKLMAGDELPSGWIGKHWACHQLSLVSEGQYLLFLDADTVLEEDAILLALRKATEGNCDLLTFMPRRIAKCVAEKLMFPFIDWAIFCWLPMSQAHKRKNPYLSATYGQFMLFKRLAYEQIGGHSRVKDNAVDDMELGRMTKREGLVWSLLDGGGLVTSLPYENNVDALKGISRSVFPALNYHVSLLVAFSILLLAIAYIPPYNFINEVISDQFSTGFFYLSLFSLSMLVISWAFVCVRFKHPKYLVILFPVSITLVVLVAYYSMFANAMQFQSWKDRGVPGRRVRL